MREFGPVERARFERLVLPHIDAAFNLAYWLLRSREDGEHVAQEALLRACRYFRGFQGRDARAWLLRIVRNTCYTWLEQNRSAELNVPFDQELHLQIRATPEGLAIASDDRARLTRATGTLPPRFRDGRSRTLIYKLLGRVGRSNPEPYFCGAIFPLGLNQRSSTGTRCGRLFRRSLPYSNSWRRRSPEPLTGATQVEEYCTIAGLSLPVLG